MGRQSRSIEIDERHCELAAKRLESELAQPMLDFGPEEPEMFQGNIFDAERPEGER
jgi:hypothetical protein